MRCPRGNVRSTKMSGYCPREEVAIVTQQTSAWYACRRPCVRRDECMRTECVPHATRRRNMLRSELIDVKRNR
jgi:hypothetical protein